MRGCWSCMRRRGRQGEFFLRCNFFCYGVVLDVHANVLFFLQGTGGAGEVLQVRAGCDCGGR